MDDSTPPKPENDAAATQRPPQRSGRRLFAEELRGLDVELRAELARSASGETLVALCFDPAPKVIAAVVENPNIGLDHGRLIAQHHRTSPGLDLLAKRAAFLRDAQTRRFLFRNPQLSNRLLRRLLATLRMAEVYRLTLSRDTTEKARAALRKTFRQKFTSGSAEERAQLIIQCEGRCLAQLLGLPLEGKTAALLSRRPLQSTLLIQNLARWPSTPPPVLEHMARQPAALRSTMLKNLIRQHPNAPARVRASKP